MLQTGHGHHGGRMKPCRLEIYRLPSSVSATENVSSRSHRCVGAVALPDVLLEPYANSIAEFENGDMIGDDGLSRHVGSDAMAGRSIFDRILVIYNDCRWESWYRRIGSISGSIYEQATELSR